MKTQELFHPYADNPATPGTCFRCGRADPKATNRIHKLPDLSAQTEEHRRRAGESEHQ